ncbi:flavodoxin domain-containing protein [Idiomarina xiamenensis]|uniref:Flavodoxin n=1 Tax=Idiomarina xiamenensis 10-D-4 TaxID=740709 RepID=K2KLE4_9GAMM|nr:flavodoxin domain-containing protein [Idiomarina xiamenensis]EKE83349.1 flavodoxin [Idiomarina xiamenensis 10-D-4]
MKTIDILVGTTSGNTEYLADQLQQLLDADGRQCRVHYEPDLVDLDNTGIWLICVASHGAGDYADSMLQFAEQLAACETRLDDLRYAVIAVGESCYDTYCAAGRDADQRLQQLGAKSLVSRLEIDMLEDDPEVKASHWLPQFSQAVAQLPEPD